MISIQHKMKSIFIFLILVLSPVYSIHNLDSFPLTNSIADLEQIESEGVLLDYSQIPSLKTPKLNYDPVLDLADSGENINFQDELSVFHSDTLSIPSAGSDIFTIDPVHDYSANELTYNMTIASNVDTINFETAENKDDELTPTVTMFAHIFTISWDYAIFHGARMFLKAMTGGYGTDEMKLYIVKEGVTGYPDTSVIYANETNGPYNSSNPLPPSSSGSFAYYEFGDPVLESGTYFIVAEKTADDGDDGTGFIWRSQQSSIHTSLSYYYSGGWNQNSATGMTLILQLQASDSEGNGVITDPSTISLQDNGQPVTSLTQTISSMGNHTLTADTSVDITLNNSYSFERNIIASSAFQAVNSTFLEYSISWDLNLYTSEFTHSPYLLPSRSLKIVLPSNWNKSSPNFLLNGSTPISVQETSYGFLIDLNQILSGGTYQNYEMTFECSSPNYLFNLTLNEDSFDLGYWTTNGTHAIGYNGSTINTNAFVREQVGVDALDGDMNFTLYDPNGAIIVKKTNPPANISFADYTDYTILETTQASAGRYAFSTVFDPSIYGTDIEGLWTAGYYWTNGTEVGFYTKTIEVRKSTQAVFEWETQPNNNIWTSDTFQEITRINGENLRVRITYYNTSDPFFLGLGVPIQSAPVEYSAEWGTSGLLSYVGPYYQSSILVDTVVGNHTIILNATGDLLQTHSESFNLTVYHTFAINAISGIDVFYKDNTVFEFNLIDTSNSSAIMPDDFAFTLDDSPLTPIAEYSTRYIGNNIELTLFTDADGLSLDEGNYDIGISATKENYLVNYGQLNATDTVVLIIKPTLTEIQNLVYESEVDLANQTSVLTVITFNYVDITHNENITGANVSVELDVAEASVKQTYETDGLYTVEIKINRTDEPSLYIALTISADGHETVVDLSLTILINDSGILGGIPTYLYIIIGIFSALAVVIPTFFIIRRKLNKDKREQKAIFKRIYSLYESVLSITKLIIVHKATGLPVYEMDLGSEITLDPSLITGFLTAISSMGVELRGDRVGGVKRLQYKNFLVTGSESGEFTLYTFSETELNEEVEDRLTVISDWFARLFSQIGADWDGSTEVFRMNLQGITEKIMKEIHLWIFYPFIASPFKAQEIDELSGFEKRIMDYILETDNVTMSRIFDDLDDIKLERGLPVLFDFVEKGLLTPVFDAYKIATVRF